jgi:hypothetical protein
MTFSYINPGERDQDAVRFEVGDTLDRDHLVEDEDILYALSVEGTVRGAAARICESLAARFARSEGFRAGAVQANKLTVTAKYLEIAKRLRASAVKAGSFVMPSVSQADKDANTLDTDIPQPFFYRGIHKNPQTEDDSSENSNSGE